MTEKFRCPKWVIMPDVIVEKVTKEFKRENFICSCAILDCGWNRERIGKIRRRIADAIFKMPLEEVMRYAKMFSVKTE